MRLPFRATRSQESPLILPAIASGFEKSENIVRADSPHGLDGRFGTNSSCSRWDFSVVLEATTIVSAIVFQGWVLRVHFDWNAPPAHGATIVVGQILPIGVYRNCAP